MILSVFALVFLLWLSIVVFVVVSVVVVVDLVLVIIISTNATQLTYILLHQGNIFSFILFIFSFLSKPR